MKFIVGLCFALLFVSPVAAETPATGPITLGISWVDTDTKATGYKIYWGTGAGVFENQADIGFPATHTSTTPFTKVFNLPGLRKLCFRLTAYNWGGESDPSPEFCNEIPTARVLLKVTFSPPRTTTKKSVPSLKK